METNELALGLGIVLAIVMVFAQVKLFSIDKTLKDILAKMEGRETSATKEQRERANAGTGV
jgi:cell division protein FtsL